MLLIIARSGHCSWGKPRAAISNANYQDGTVRRAVVSQLYSSRLLSFPSVKPRGSQAELLASAAQLWTCDKQGMGKHGWLAGQYRANLNREFTPSPDSCIPKLYADPGKVCGLLDRSGRLVNSLESGQSRAPCMDNV